MRGTHLVDHSRYEINNITISVLEGEDEFTSASLNVNVEAVALVNALK